MSDFTQAVQYAKQLSYWRGLTQVDGLLAKHICIKGLCNRRWPRSMKPLRPTRISLMNCISFPRNLAIKAEIMARLGNTKHQSLYTKKARTCWMLYSVRFRRRLSNANF